MVVKFPLTELKTAEPFSHLLSIFTFHHFVMRDLFVQFNEIKGNQRNIISRNMVTTYASIYKLETIFQYEKIYYSLKICF